MRQRFVRAVMAVGSGALLMTGLIPATVQASGGDEETVIVTSANGDVSAANLSAHGHQVVGGLEAAGVLIVRTTDAIALAGLTGVSAVSHDRIRVRVPNTEGTIAEDVATTTAGCASTTSACPKQWDLDRINVPDAWTVTQGDPSVRVAILDTGVTSTHNEVVGSNYDIASSRSFVQPSAFCPADAATFASVEDFQGHGTWTNTHVAGKNGSRMTGIAPGATFVNIRVLGACGFGFDSWILNGMLYANSVGARVESMSLGGFLCAGGVVPGSVYCPDAAAVGSDPQIYAAYVQVVRYLQKHGTIVVAAAGNEGAEVGAGGQILNHASLAFNSIGPDPFNDLTGLYEVPGGVPGVIAVSALNRVAAVAPAGSTIFGQPGPGLSDQLAYYSNSGSRIDISAPGGARNYNIPRFDCLTSQCRRAGSSTPAGTDNPEDFGAWGVDAAGNPCNTCYIYVQGTSMATPQVAGVAALALSVRPHLSAEALAQLLKHAVTGFSNANRTPVTDEDPSQPTYNYDLDYDGPAVSNSKMGSGVINAALAVGLHKNDSGHGG